MRLVSSHPVRDAPLGSKIVGMNVRIPAGCVPLFVEWFIYILFIISLLWVCDGCIPNGMQGLLWRCSVLPSEASLTGCGKFPVSSCLCSMFWVSGMGSSESFLVNGGLHGLSNLTIRSYLN